MMPGRLVAFPIRLTQRKLLHFANPTIRTTHQFVSAPLFIILWTLTSRQESICQSYSMSSLRSWARGVFAILVSREPDFA